MTMTGAMALLESGAAALPTDIPAVAAHFGIKLVDYNSFTKVYDFSKQQLYRTVSYGGFSMVEEGQFVCVIIGALCGQTRRRWTLAHEIGHVLCGHVSGEDIPTPSQEREADRFAAELLAPLTVLHFCGASSPIEVERLCGLSRQAAEARFRELSRMRRIDEERYAEALRRGEAPPESVFLNNMENRELFRRFPPFISAYITRRSAHDGYGNYLEMKSRNRMAI